MSISLLGMKEPEAREKSGGGRGRVEEHQEVGSSSREEGGLCLKWRFHKNIIGRELVSTVPYVPKSKLCLGSINTVPVPVPLGHRNGS